MNALLIALPLLIGSCSDDNNSYNDPATVPTDIIQTVVKTTDNISIGVSTDKAAYKPGETVRFTVTDGTLPSSAHVRYRHGADVIADENIGSTSWTWTAPQADYTGYMADIYTTDANNQQTIYATIGVDVSSDWARFPRYGFIASYGNDRTSDVIASELSMLNRCHINGLQFYDWQYKQHWPLGGTPDNLLESYKDIANRDNYTSVVKDYIAQAHSLGMKAMFYNLCFGVFDDAKADGVGDHWYIYTDQNLLRDGGSETQADIAAAKSVVTINAWPPVLGNVTAYSKNVNGKQVVNLINFRQANSLSWRDMDGTMPEPEAVDNLTLRMRAKNVKKLWVASPDQLGGAPQELKYRQEGDFVVFTVPQLKYWTMIVAE